MDIFQIDIKIVIFLAMSLTFILSLLLALVRFGIDYADGPGYWALGNLSVSLGMAVFLIKLGDFQSLIILGPVLIAIGIGLFINGIQAFNHQTPDLHIPITIAIGTAIVDSYLILINNDLRTVISFNSALFSLAYVGAARMLFRQTVSGDLRLLYNINSGLFLLMATVMAIRASAAMFATSVVFSQMADWPIYRLTFMAAIAIQLCVTFCFVLMLNHRQVAKLERISTHDVLTGILNRNGLIEAAVRVEATCRKHDEPMTVLSIDIDAMARINHDFSNFVGDEALRELAGVLVERARPIDLVGRYGNDEFCMVLPGVTESEAMAIAEEIRDGFQFKLILADNEHTNATVSIGVCGSERLGEDFSVLYAAAHSAMYNAKELGRNRVVAHSVIHQFGQVTDSKTNLGIPHVEGLLAT